MATKKPSKKKKPSSAIKQPQVHTEATATMLSFANPPAANDAEAVAEECAQAGFAEIGIHGPLKPSDVIDFGAIDQASCEDLANSIEHCVGSKGFEIPSLSDVFVVMHQKGTKITFSNFIKALTVMMTPKA